MDQQIVATSSRKANARLEKWRSMLSVGLHKDSSLLLNRTRKGIPPSLRAVMWPQLVRLNNFVKQSSVSSGGHLSSRESRIMQQKTSQNIRQQKYEAYLSLPSQCIYEIALDIPRTFPEEEDAKALRKPLNNVLKAVAHAFPKIGYCQGMNFITMRLLEVLPDEDAFWLLSYLLSTDKRLAASFVDPSSVREQSYVLEQLLMRHLPKVYNTFVEQDVLIMGFAMKWFLTLFANTVSRQLFCRLFESFLLEGWTVLFAAALAMFRRWESQILKDSSFDSKSLIGRSVEAQSQQQIDQFMEKVFAWRITQLELSELSNSYFQINKAKANEANSSKSQQNSNHVLETRQLTNKALRRFDVMAETEGIVIVQQAPWHSAISINGLKGLKPTD